MSEDPRLEGLFGRGQKRPLYSRLPWLYFALPSWARSLGRKFAAARRGDTSGLLDLYLNRLPATRKADASPIPLLLTHDVDTAEGLAFLPRLLELEERHGFRSLTFLVTHRYPLDRAAIAKWKSCGHRFGIHDTNHDNQIAYSPVAEIAERMDRARGALDELGLPCFRSPAFLRSRALYEGIAGKIDFDFSSNDWALAWPFPGDGIGSAHPFLWKQIVCAPTTLPRDGEMLALGLTSEQKLDLLAKKCERLRAAGCPAVFLNHPDPGFTNSDQALDEYGRILAWMRDSGNFEVAGVDETLARIRRDAEAAVGE